MLSRFALWLVSTLIEMAVIGTVGCQVSGIRFGHVRRRERPGIGVWLRGSSQDGNSSFPTGNSPPVVTTRVAALLPRHGTALLGYGLGRRDGSGGCPFASLDALLSGAVLLGAGLSR